MKDHKAENSETFQQFWEQRDGMEQLDKKYRVTKDYERKEIEMEDNAKTVDVSI